MPMKNNCRKVERSPNNKVKLAVSSFAHTCRVLWQTKADSGWCKAITHFQRCLHHACFLFHNVATHCTEGITRCELTSATSKNWKRTFNSGQFLSIPCENPLVCRWWSKVDHFGNHDTTAVALSVHHSPDNCNQQGAKALFKKTMAQKCFQNAKASSLQKIQTDEQKAKQCSVGLFLAWFSAFSSKPRLQQIETSFECQNHADAVTKCVAFWCVTPWVDNNFLKAHLKWVAVQFSVCHLMPWHLWHVVIMWPFCKQTAVFFTCPTCLNSSQLMMVHCHRCHIHQNAIFLSALHAPCQNSFSHVSQCQIALQEDCHQKCSSPSLCFLCVQPISGLIRGIVWTVGTFVAFMSALASACLCDKSRQVPTLLMHFLSDKASFFSPFSFYHAAFSPCLLWFSRGHNQFLQFFIFQSNLKLTPPCSPLWPPHHPSPFSVFASVMCFSTLFLDSMMLAQMGFSTLLLDSTLIQLHGTSLVLNSAGV